MKKEIQKIIQEAIGSLKKAGNWPDLEIPEIVVENTREEKFGDYSSNIAMILAKNLKKNPEDVASEILHYVQDDKFKKIEVVKPGYINFYLSEEYFQKLIKDINQQKEGFGNFSEKEKVMIEYSQPNTHKEFHIGHLRNVIIGSSLVELLKKSGQSVIAANYIGDTGTHIGKILWSLKKFYSEEDLEKTQDKVEFLGKAYSRATKEIENNTEYEKEFKELQKKFEEGDAELVALWKKTRQWSLDEFSRIYKKLGTKFDVYFYESEEEIEGKKILPELLKFGIIKESQGAIIADLEKYNLGVLVLQRSDGAALYGLKDIPLAIKKFEKFNIDKSIYIVDLRQELYLKQIFKILELVGFKKSMVHIGYNFVNLKGGESMSSRKGNIVSANFLLHKVREEVSKKFPDSPDPEEISLSAIKFFMLKYSPNSKIDFDIEESIKLNGASGPYVQYAYARICSILEKAEINNSKSGENAKLELLNNGKEFSLMRELNKFPELVEEISKNYEVHKLPQYAIKLADKFHSFYNECRVIDEENLELSSARLELVKAVRIVLGETLRLIGVSAPERM